MEFNNSQLQKYVEDVFLSGNWENNQVVIYRLDFESNWLRVNLIKY